MWKRTGKDGKRMRKDGKRMRKGANIAITYRYSIDIEEDFAKLDSDPARTCQLQVRHGGKRSDSHSAERIIICAERGDYMDAV